MTKNKKNHFERINPLHLLSFSGGKRVPLILQSEIAECGLASLAMIASYYGCKMNLGRLRSHLKFDSKGMNLRQLMEVSSELNLASRALKCDLEAVGNLRLPCILHWNLDHFVVLTKVTKKHFFINDPAFGKRRLNNNQFSESYTGVALELTPTSDFRVADQRLRIKISQLWERIVGLKRNLISLFVLSVTLQFTGLLSPYYTQWIIDDVLLSNDKPLLIVLATGFSLLLVVRTVIDALRNWLILRFNSTLSIQMAANIFHHMIRLPMTYFEKRHIGDIVSRFRSTSRVRELLTTGIIQSIIDGVMALLVLIVMYLYSQLLATIVVVFVIISFITQIAFYYPNRRISEELIIAQAKEETSFLESIRAIQAIKLFSHETKRENLWLNRYAEVTNSNIRLGKITISESTLNSLILGLENILILYFGALTVIKGDLTVGMLLAFIAYKGQFTSSMISLIDKIISFKLLDLYLERLSDIVLEKKESNSISLKGTPENLKGYLRVENLSFRYSEHSDFIIKNLSFEVKEKEHVVITGSSGCGKSTLIKILLGLLSPTEGNIYLDGVDIKNYSQKEYREKFAAVMQNDSLLSGSLAENISMFDERYDEARVIECCKMACIWDDIQKLPMKLYSLVGDMGNIFSGGQLQRIFLARALYKNPLILCLDESSSHLDADNEIKINNNLKKMKITQIVIAHRKETIMGAERVIQLS